MKKLFYLFITLSISTILSGCAASGEKHTTLTELNDIDENLIIYRPSMSLGSALQPTVYVDDQYLGSLENAGFIKYAVKPGAHVLKVGNKETKFSVTKDEKHYYKYNVRTSLLFFITITPEQLSKVNRELAMNELTETKLSTHRIDN